MIIPFPWSEFDLNDLPPSMQKLAGQIGLEATLALLAEHHGERKYIPNKIKSEHWIVNSIGADLADMICKEYGGNYIEFPVCSIKQNFYLIRREKRNQKTISAIAHQHRRSIRSVLQILAV